MEENKVETKMENNMERLMDVEMNVTVRFGRTEMPLREVVRFGVGSMIELNRSVDEPVELLVNNSPFARGEVVVIDGYYGVRVTEIGGTDLKVDELVMFVGKGAVFQIWHPEIYAAHRTEGRARRLQRFGAGGAA